MPSLAIVASRFNPEHVEGLLAGALAATRAAGIPSRDVCVVRVPGAWEIPVAVDACLRRARGAVALGCILRGETSHDEVIAHAVAGALQGIAVRTGKPVGLGIVTAGTEAQARARCRPGSDNRGAAAVAAVLETLAVLRSPRGRR